MPRPKHGDVCEVWSLDSGLAEFRFVICTAVGKKFFNYVDGPGCADQADADLAYQQNSRETGGWPGLLETNA